MKNNVMLTIRGTQRYMDQEPEVIELVTEGLLEKKDDSWEITYQESHLTGLEGGRHLYYQSIHYQQVLL